MKARPTPDDGIVRHPGSGPLLGLLFSWRSRNSILYSVDSNAESGDFVAIATALAAGTVALREANDLRKTSAGRGNYPDYQ